MTQDFTLAKLAILKVANLHCSWQQCVVVDGQGIVLQLGLGLGREPGNGIFPFFFFFLCKV